MCAVWRAICSGKPCRRPLSDLTPEQLRTAGERTRWYLYEAEREEYEWILDFQLAIEQGDNAWAMWAGDTD